MTLRNEVLEGLYAMKGAQEAFGGTSRDRYYNELYKAQRRINDDFTARRVAREKAIAAGRPSTPVPLQTATSAPPVVQQAFSPAAPPLQKPLDLSGTYADGGMIKRPFDPEGDGYDDETAEWEGVHPERNPEDGKMHGMSRVPRTGLQLKGRKHPTWDKAIETDRKLGYGLEMRDGRYYTQKFADGGAVLRQNQRDFMTPNTRAVNRPGQGAGDFPGMPGAPEDDPTEADLIVDQLLGAEGAAARKINKTVGMPQEPSTFSAAGDWAAEGAKERVRAGRAARMPGVPVPEEPPAVTSEEVNPPQDVPRERTLRQSAANREQTRAAATAPEITYPNPLPTSSRFERAIPGIAESATVGTVGRGLDLQPDPNYDEKERLEYEMYETRPGLFEQTTEPERQRRAKRLEELEAERAALDVKQTPTSQPAQTPTPAGAPPGAVSDPAASDPEQMAQFPRMASTRPNQTPANGAATTPQGSQVSGQTNGPPVSNVQSGPTGRASTPAPPAGSASANSPSTALKTDAPGPGGTRVPRGSLQDQTRTAAFDPVKDFNDPNRVAATTPLNAYTPQDYQQVMQGVASVAQQGPVGRDAITRDRLNRYVGKNSQGGKFTEGEAMLVGMLSDYKMLLSQGYVDEANKMAYGLIQAASLEAASYGMVAMDAVKAGDYRAAMENTVMALNWLPDGKSFKSSPDGKVLYAFNAQTGQPTGQTQVSPQQLLALLTGVTDGSLLWNALQSSAAMVGKQDRNAEGRQLTNALRREQIEGARLRNAKLRAGGTGGRAAPGFSSQGSRLNALLSGVPTPTSGGGTSRAQGDDTGYIDVEVNDPPDEPE